ncbi:hypothetical protein [Streptomyces xanthii]|uniref:Uncharacterized protein n=1 Tax=Streptomyces xanthii TaxID=2768069 RepID=A0A7H1BC57_9ACTN|nr:hypothetical protein [Streptomyces xanthii]QNS06312.1 hypothetical protein IAG42_23850 [Streptomyces xanthii]
MGRRLLGFAIVWAGFYGAMALGAVPGSATAEDRLMGFLVSLPAWGYIGLRVRREILRARETVKPQHRPDER